MKNFSLILEAGSNNLLRAIVFENDATEPFGCSVLDIAEGEREAVAAWFFENYADRTRWVRHNNENIESDCLTVWELAEALGPDQVTPAERAA